MNGAGTSASSVISRRRLAQDKRKMVMVLALMVALLTAIALMVPAVSMTRGDLVCGMEEHSHSEACYEQVLTCDEEEGENHQHGDKCYTEELACNIPEHQHQDACYAAEEPEPEPEPEPVFETQAVTVEEPAAEPDPAADTNATTEPPAARGIASQEPADDNAGTADDTDTDNADNAGTDNDDNTDNAGTDDNTDTGTDDDTDVDTDTAADPDPAAEFPEQSLWDTIEDKDGNITYVAAVEAPQGALPANAQLEVKGVRDKDARPNVEYAIADSPEFKDTVEIGKMVPVKLVFKDEAGKKVEPALPVTVKLTTFAIRDIEQPQLVHALDPAKALEAGKVDEDGNPKAAEFVGGFEVVNQNEEGTAEETRDTLKFDTDESGEYIIVELKAVGDGADDGNADTENAEDEDTDDEAATDDESPMLITAPELPATKFSEELKDAAGNVTLTVDVDAPEGALPEGATMKVTPVTEDDTLSAAKDAAEAEAGIDAASAEAVAVDITFYDADGAEIEPQADVHVTMSAPAAAKQDELAVVHLPADESAELVETTAVDPATATAEFDSADFSVYALVYTVIKEHVVDAKGKAWEITVTYDDNAGIPDGSELKVKEILPQDADYQKYYGQSVEKAGAVGAGESDAENKSDADAASNEQAADSAEAGKEAAQYARIFDIEIWNGNQKIEPKNDVVVSIKLLDAPADTKATPKVVHFAKKGPELMELMGTAEAKSDAAEFKFATDEFSVYSVVYTVDFEFEINGKVYRFSIPGGGYLPFDFLVEKLHIASNDSEEEAHANASTVEEESSDDAVADEGPSGTVSADDITSLEISEATREFVDGIDDIEFSNPDLLWVGKAEEDTTVHGLREKHKLDNEYPANITQQEVDKILAAPVEKGSWVLLSMHPFDTVETLTVTMKTGEVFTIKVTDAKDAIMNEDGQTVQTIPNPSGTTITLFDYWIDRENETARRGWPGYSRSGTTGTESEFWNYWTNNKHNGTNTGINANHKLKFVPGSDDTADDYLVSNGTRPGYTQNGRLNGINSWNGRWDDRNNRNVYNGAPTQGIVAGALYNSNGQLDANGYPRLNLNNGNGDASNRESLDYLFNTGTSHSGKRSYGEVNRLFYVDPDGYYTYESMDYKAKLQPNKTFELREQPSSATTEGQIGFWPFDDLNYWLGMHMHVNFSVPANGEVLNPRGDYMPMQFEFAGDDDAWVYIDGILVADGGGIHNRTEIDINFQTGHSQVRGGEYTNILQPNEPVVTDKTLYEIFTEAHAKGLISDEKWASDYTNSEDKVVWIDSDGDNTLDTFAPGTKHTFDFFYLERGGGESNLYIHYNLISTTDYSAHKSFHGADNPATEDVDESRLERDQFRFELIGYDNPAYESEGAEFVKAIMPNAITWDASKESGTFDNPLWNTVPATETTPGYRCLKLGNTEDGNVNFGDVQVVASQVGKEYKYVVREAVPDNAVNADGVRWADASDELKREGGFVYNGTTYDSREYYFIGKVEETSPGSQQYEVKKYRYLDPDYTQPDTETKFFSFVNGTETPVSLKVNKKSDTGAALDGAVFSLTRAMQNADAKWVVREWTINNVTSHSQPVTGTTSGGTLTFGELTEGHYILEELEAPAGYQMGDQHRWLLTLEKQDSNKEIQLVPYITPLDAEGTAVGNKVPLGLPDDENTIEYEVLNGPLPPIDLSLEKRWNDNGDTSVPDNAEATFELHRIKEVPLVRVKLLDSQGEKVDEITASVGDTIKIYDTATGADEAFEHHMPAPGGIAVLFGDNVRTRSDTVTPNDSGWIIQTRNVYELDWFTVVLGSSTSTSNGQYTVKQADITADVVELRLSDNYMASQTYGFDKLPQLYISNHASGSTTVDEVISTFTLKQQGGNGDAGNPWKKSFDDLPVVDENGHPYSYYFTEVSHSPANFVPSYQGNMGSADSPLTESGDVIVTNNAPELPKITASKVWKDENGNPIDAESGLDGLEVKLTLYKGESVAPEADLKTGGATKTVSGNGTATWTLKNENADVAEYSVRETAVKIPGGDFVDVTSENNPFTGAVDGNPSIGYTVTNQLPDTEISVTKQWKDGTSANADRVFDEAKTIGFTLYQKLDDDDGAIYEIEDQPVTGTVAYAPASGETAASWSTATISGLPKYAYQDGSWYEADYYPVEDEIDGVRVAYQKADETATEDPADAAVASGTVTIINTDIVVPIRIVKVDQGNTATGLTGAKFQLTRKLAGEGGFTKFEHSSFEVDPENEGKHTGPFTVTSTSGIILEGLLPGEYQIEEIEPPAGYINSLPTFTFTVSADGSITSSDADDTLVVHLEKEGDNPEGFQIGNISGTPLPITGGPGTTVFSVLGSILVLAAGGMLWRRRQLV